MSTSHQPERFKLRNVAAALCATGALAFGSASAQAQVPGLDVYVGGGVGQSDADVSAPDFDSKDFAWKVFVGARAFSFVGAELNYIDFGKPSGGGNELEYKGFAGYGVFYVPLPLPILDVYLKAGVARLDIDVPTEDFSTDDTKFAYGGGLQLKFGSFAVRAEYEQYEVKDLSAKPSLLSVGFSKSFL
jgi:opacity protein-like surface antigen